MSRYTLTVSYYSSQRYIVTVEEISCGRTIYTKEYYFASPHDVEDFLDQCMQIPGTEVYFNNDVLAKFSRWQSNNQNKGTDYKCHMHIVYDRHGHRPYEVRIDSMSRSGCIETIDDSYNYAPQVRDKINEINATYSHVTVTAEGEAKTIFKDFLTEEKEKEMNTELAIATNNETNMKMQYDFLLTVLRGVLSEEEITMIEENSDNPQILHMKYVEAMERYNTQKDETEEASKRVIYEEIEKKAQKEFYGTLLRFGLVAVIFVVGVVALFTASTLFVYALMSLVTTGNIDFLVVLGSAGMLTFFILKWTLPFIGLFIIIAKIKSWRFKAKQLVNDTTKRDYRKQLNNIIYKGE